MAFDDVSPECALAQVQIAHLKEQLAARERAIEEGTHEMHYHPGTDTAEFWYLTALALGFLCLAALASGLTVGLMGIDRTNLRLKMVGDDAVDRRRAERIMKVTKDHHRLLITLLLANTAANECLPIVLDRLVPAWLAITLSIFCVLIFGEILPMSLLTGPRQLELVAKITGVVESMMWLLSWAAVPVATLLDHLVGSSHRTKTFSRREMQSLLRMNVPARGHAAKADASGAYSRAGVDSPNDCNDSDDERGGEHLSHSDVRLAVSVLDFSTRSAAHCMRGLNEVFMLDSATPFDASLLQRIREEGYSRVPVYTGRRDRIVGVLLAKALVGLDPRPELTIKQWAACHVPSAPSSPGKGAADAAGSPRAFFSVGGLPLGAEESSAAGLKPARSLAGPDEAAGDSPPISATAAKPWLRPLLVGPQLALPSLLKQFRTHASGCQLALVVQETRVLGIVTVKDALEELMQEALEDEFDRARRPSRRPDDEWHAWSRSSPRSGPAGDVATRASARLSDTSASSTSLYPRAGEAGVGTGSLLPTAAAPASTLGKPSVAPPAASPRTVAPSETRALVAQGRDEEQVLPLSNSGRRRSWDGDITPGGAV